MLQDCPPTKEQSRDVDYLLAGGQIFALIVYGQLILENAKIHGLEEDLIDELFDVFCRDFSRYALELHDKPGTNEDQMARCLQMLEKPQPNDARYQSIWEEHVHPLKDGYVMPD